MSLNWQDRAACKGISLDIMFPDNPGGQESVYRKGLEFCKKCEVIDHCLAFALEHESGQRYRFGVYGGKTPRERSAMTHTPTPLTYK